MKNSIFRSLALILLICATALNADIIYLKNGKELVGDVVNQNRKEVRFKIGNEIRKIPKTTIKRIKYGDTAAELKKRKEAEERRRAEEQQLAEEKRRKAEEQRRQAEEKRKAEEERRKAEEKRQAEEKERREAEAERLAEEERKAEEVRRRAEEERLEEERRKAEEEAERLEEEREAVEDEKERELRQAEEERLSRHHITPRLLSGKGKVSPLAFHNNTSIINTIASFNASERVDTTSPSTETQSRDFEYFLADDEFEQESTNFQLNYYYNRYSVDLELLSLKTDIGFATIADSERWDPTNGSYNKSKAISLAVSNKYLRDEKSLLFGYDFYRSDLLDIGVLLGGRRLDNSIDYNRLSLFQFEEILPANGRFNGFSIATRQSNSLNVKGPSTGLKFRVEPLANLTVTLKHARYKMEGEWSTHSATMSVIPAFKSAEVRFFSIGSDMTINGQTTSLGIKYNLFDYVTLSLDYYNSKYLGERNNILVISSFETVKDFILTNFAFAPILSAISPNPETMVRGVMLGIERKFDF